MIEYFIKGDKTSAKFRCRGVDYVVLVHKFDNKWQYYVKAHGCEAILNLEEQIFNVYNHEPDMIAKRIDTELRDFLKTPGWRA